MDAGCPRPKPRAAKAQRTAVPFCELGWVLERSPLGLEESEVTPSSPPLLPLAETAVDGGTGTQILPVNTSSCKMSISKSVYNLCVPCTRRNEVLQRSGAGVLWEGVNVSN